MRRNRYVMPGRIPADPGFTLVELMIAAAVMSSGLVLVAGSLLSIHNTRALVADQSAAASRVNTVVNELRQATPQQLLGYVPPELETLGSATVVVVYELDGKKTLTPPVDPSTLPEGFVLPDPVRVRVTLSGTSSTGRQYSVRAETYVRP